MTPHWPHKATCGTEIRAFHIRKALEQIGTVHVAVADAEGEHCYEGRQERITVAHELNVTILPSGGFLRKIRWALNPCVPYPHGTRIDAEDEKRILGRVQDYDLIWFNKLRTANMFSNLKWPRSVIDVDDVPSTYEKTMFANARGIRNRVLAAARMISWRRRERLIGDRFCLVGVCSEGDREYLKGLKVRAPIHVIPNGAERTGEESIRNPASPARIGFVGLLEYRPNRDAIQWFVQSCWPRIKQEIPDARLRIAGKGSDGIMKPAGPDIDGLGWVPRLEDEISTWSAMIVPIRVGAGTREKIAYGFSLKCPIISTNLGAFGYKAQNEEDLLLADTPEEFSAACIRIIRGNLDVEAMTARAYQKYLQRWSWEAIAPSIWNAANECLRMNADPCSGRIQVRQPGVLGA